MLFLYRFFCGVLQVEFFGIYPEKVLNLCAKNGISIWSARFVKQKICCKITIKDFLRLRKILRKSGIRVHIKRKTGFPFFIKKYNKRFGIFAGFIIFFAFLQIMSGHIWIIDVVGNQRVTEAEILSLCKQIGITVGVSKKNISPKADAQELLLKTDSLAWSSLNIEGCRLTVNVTEITEKTEDTSKPSNLKATADGVIKHIDVKAGNCVVKVGEVVKKGDVLVSGIIENLSGTRFVHSIGQIIAETETAVTLREPFTKKVTVPNGRVKSKRVLEFFNLKIPLYLGSEKGKFKTVESVWQLRLFSQKLPLKLYSKRFVFQNEHTAKQSYEKVVETLEKRLQDEFTGEPRTKNFSKAEEFVTLEAVLVEQKDIAISEEIMTSTNEQGSE